VGEIERSAHKGRLTDVGVIRLPDKRDPDEVMRDDPTHAGLQTSRSRSSNT
jgi:hypothetical protein